MKKIKFEKTLKKLISLGLAVSLAVSCLAGCGESSDTGAGKSSDTGVGKSPNTDAGKSPNTGGTSGDSSFSIKDAVDDNYRNYYEIFPGSFYDSNGDGTGDLNGITEKLDYIAELGCSGIWLTPIMSSPSYHKYDTTDYYSVDPDFGTNDDFKLLTETAHEKGIRVIIDLVINHSSSEHPWFTEACDYLRNLPEGEEPDPSECPYVDYYHFSREQVDSSYREVTGSDWYYEAVFDYSQPDLNLYNDELVGELEDTAAFWIGLGADGFRMDAAMHYDDSDSSFNIDFLKKYYDFCLTQDPDFYMVSEVWSSEKTIADYYAGGTPSFFNFDAADAEGKLIKAGRGTLGAEKFAEAMLDYQETFGAANPDYIDAPFITNHDMGRAANAVQSDIVSLKMTAGLLLTMNGSPFIYYGEEIGMKSKGKKDENKRLHMNWSDTDTTGICADPAGADTDIEQSLPAVDIQLEDEDSLLHYYKEALALRNANPEIARGRMEIVDSLTDGSVAVITKTWNDQTVAVLINTGEDGSESDLTGTPLETMEIIGDLEAHGSESSGAVLNGGKVTLPGRSIVYMR